MDEPNNRIVIFKSVESLLSAHNKGKIFLNANFIKDQINSFVEIKESIGRPNPNTILWDEKETEWLKTLEDLIFVLKLELIELENIQVLFSVREKYDDCLIRYMEKLKAELQSKDPYIITTRIQEERANLINLLPALRYPYSLRIKHSLLRKAIHWLETNPQKQWKTSIKEKRKSGLSPAEIFKETGEELFNYLNENYTKDNKHCPTKYSNIWRFMDYQQLLICDKKEYIKFIKSEFNVTMSKILNQQFKYKDNIEPLLHNLYKQFKQNNSN